MVKQMLLADSYLPLLKDPYGNYVVQKTLAVAEKDDKAILISKIKPIMEDLRKTSDFGSKIYNKLIKAHPCLQVKGKNVKNKNKKSNQNPKKVPPPVKPNKFPLSQEQYPLYQSYNQQPNFFPPQPPQGYYNQPDSFE
mmetsp:Transcript_24689/g.27349  ORF Transcript_24689/g.27349 Transcript_24689/m.27349 type:complete len:138 (-) Transcript_24689:66-479(-)